MAVTEIDNSVTAGFEALNRNDPAAARRHFEQAVARDSNSPLSWYGLSCALRLTGADDEEGAALDRALGLEANYLQALIAKGDWHTRRKQTRTAGSFYQAALEIGKTANLPPFWRAEVERIKRVAQSATETYQAHFQSVLAGKGLGQPGTERVAQSVEMLLGRRKLYPQQPSHYYFPGLPQKEFYEREDFPWAPGLEAQTPAIRAELEAVLAGGQGIVPYIPPLADRANTPANTLGLMNDPRWSAFNLILNGNEVAENTARCPRTMAALKNLPLCRIDGRSPSVLFSILRPGVRIPPHHGYTNARLICHLPLIVPPNCGALRVGNDARPWTEGKLMMFDDSVEHEANNSSNQVRVVLLFDVWRPELSEKERELVAAMLASINQFGGTADQWGA